MYSELRSSDAQILTRLVENASDSYLRESKITRKSTFGIIRILAAHKKLSDQYSLRKDEIYNWIMYITKHYNPKSVKQWLSAIQELSSIGQTQKISTTHEYQLNLPKQIRFNTSMSNILSLAESSRESIFKYHCKSRKQLSSFDIKHETSTNNVPVSSKLHYISFEPEPENKENINSNNLRYPQEPEPSQTNEQSFINTLHNSRSPFITSKITYHTKDVTETQERDEEFQTMKARADIFYSINSQLKGFTGLLANFEAYESYKQLRNNAISCVKKIYFDRFLCSFANLSQTKKFKLKRTMKAEMHYEKRKKRTVFNIFKVLFSLKISPRKRVQINKFNTYNYEFLISLMFFVSSENSSPRNMKEIPNKFKYFKNLGDYAKLQAILSNFTNNPKVTREQIQNIFQLQKNSILRKCFSALKKKVKSYEAQIQQVREEAQQKNLKKVFQILIFKRNQGRKVNEFIKSKNLKLKNKYFHLINQLVLSKKIYSKRFEFLSMKNQQNTKKEYFVCWKKALFKQLIEKRNRMEKISMGIKMMKNAITQPVFTRMTEVVEFQIAHEKKVNQQKEKNLLRAIMHTLKERVQQKKIFAVIRAKNNKKLQKSVIKTWKKKTLLVKGLKSIQILFQRSTLKNLIGNIKFAEHQQKLIKNKKVNDCQNFIKQFRLCHKLDKEEESNKIQDTKNHLFKFKVETLMENLKRVLEEKRRRQQKQSNEKCKLELQKWRKNKQQRQLLSYLLIQRQNKLQFELKTLKVEDSCILKRRVEFVDYLKSEREINKKIHQVQLKKENNALKSTFLILNRMKNHKKAENMNNEVKFKKMKKIFALFNENVKIMHVKEIVAKQKYRNKIKHRIFNELVLNLERGHSKIHQIANLHEEYLKERAIKDFRNIMIQKQQTKSNVKTLLGKVFISKLRNRKERKEQLRYKNEEIVNLRKQQFLQKLKENCNVPELKNTYRNYNDLGMKIIWLNRFQSGVTRKILNRKVKYMALKMKAMQLMKLAFTGLLLESKYGKKNRNPTYDHFSTEYSSI